jgi:hypothetical protein
MISDAVSLTILIRDLFFAYSHIVNGHPVTWPGKAGSFADYAVWQRNTLPSQLQKQSEWTERLVGRGCLRFPTSSTRESTGSGWAYSAFRIDADVKSALQSWARTHRTTLVMGVFTAYAAAVLCWCNASGGVIQYQWNGRVSPRDDDIVGFFASMLYLHIERQAGASLVEFLRHVVEQYCEAYEHADFNYLEAELRRPEVFRNPTFNWTSERPNIALRVSDGPEGELTCSTLDPETSSSLVKYFSRDNEPMAFAHETDAEVVFHLFFPLSRFATEAMNRFGASVLTFVMALLERPQALVEEIARRLV